jgi:hypothetical protein
MVRLTRFLTAVSVALFLTACHITPGPAPVPPDASDSGALPAWNAADVCGSAAARIEAIGCKAAQPESGTWADACANARKHGLTFGVPCIRQATTATALLGCGVSCVAYQLR